MVLSTSEILVRTALALLLPLYMRTTCLFEFSIIVLATALITTVGLWHTRQAPDFETHRTLDIELALRVMLVLVWAWLANILANFLVVGSWLQLSMTYLLLWDAKWRLFPGVALEHRARINNLWNKNRRSPLLIIPCLIATSLTIFLAGHGSLHDQGSISRLIAIGFLVLLAIADPLVHLSGLIVHLCSRKQGRVDENPTKMTKAFTVNKLTAGMKDTKYAKPREEMRTLRNGFLPSNNKYRGDLEEKTPRYKKMFNEASASDKNPAQELASFQEMVEGMGTHAKQVKPSTRRRG